MARDLTPTTRRGYPRPPIGDDWADAWDTLVDDLDDASLYDATDEVRNKHIATNAVTTSELDLSISPTWAGTHDFNALEVGTFNASHEWVLAGDHNTSARTIQDAVNALPSGGGVVHLGAGTFQVDSAVALPSDRPVIVRGQGDATILDGDAGTHALLSCDGGSPAIEHCTVQNSSVGIDLDTTADYDSFRITDVTFDSLTSHAVHLLDDDITVGWFDIEGCTVTNSARGFYIRPYRIDGGEVRGNRLDGISVRAIVVGLTTGSGTRHWQNVAIADNTIVDVVGSDHTIGIQLFGHYHSIVGNHIENVGRDDGNPRSEGIDCRCVESTIANNRLLDAGGDAGSISTVIGDASRDGDVTRGTGLIITNNHIEFQNSHIDDPRGINTRTEELIIEGNVILGAYSAINIRRGNHMVIANNEITRATAGSGSYVFGIRLVISGSISDPTSPSLSITGNRFEHFKDTARNNLAIRFEPVSGSPISDVLINDNIFRNFDAGTNTERGIDFSQVDSGDVQRINVNDNVFDGVEFPVAFPSNPSDLEIRNNRGFRTEDGGEVSLTGTGSDTNFTWSHGLAQTPTQVNLTLETQTSAGEQIETYNRSSSEIGVNFDTAPADTETVTVGWSAVYSP